MSRTSRLRSRAYCDERGVAVVEFAIALPVAILLVFGITQFSFAYQRQQGLHSAAGEGARVAAKPQTTSSEIDAHVRSALKNVLSPREIDATTVTVTPSGDRPCSTAGHGSHVVVDVTVPNQLAVPLLSKESLTLTGRGEVPCE